MSILAKLVLVAVIFAAGLASGIKIHAGIIAQRDLKAVQDNARVQILRADKADQAAARHETAKADIQVIYETIEKEVRHVVEKPVYRNICLDDDGLRVLAAAIAAGDNPPGKPATAVSSPVVP